jgi:hypothetical protein
VKEKKKGRHGQIVSDRHGNPLVSVVDAVNAKCKALQGICFTLYLNAMDLREDSIVSLKEDFL